MKTAMPASEAVPNLLIPEDLNQNNFDLLRFLLATCVIYSHCFVLLYLKMEDVEPLRRATRNQVDFGGIAVSFFFVISGFLIARSFQFSRSNKDYFIKRILRIFPGFIVAFLISVFLFGLVGTATALHKLGNWDSYFSTLNFKRILWQLATLEAPKGAKTFLSNPLPHHVNDSLWTIQYEALCYLIVPLLGVIGMMKKKWIGLLVFLSAYAVLLLQQRFGGVGIYDNEWNWVIPYPSELPRLFAYFFAGSCVYLYRPFIVRSKLLAFLSLIALCIAAWVVPVLKYVLPLAGVYLLFYGAYHPRIRFPNFATRGDFSYGLYLYGWPVQQLAIYFWGPQLSAHGLFFIAFPVTLMLAYGSWHLVERRFLKMKRLLHDKKTHK